MIQLQGWTEVPKWWHNWMYGGSEYWVAVWWTHLQTGHHSDFLINGEPVGKAFTFTPTLLEKHPVDPSIVLVLDAWIRFFDVWEPE